MGSGGDRALADRLASHADDFIEGVLQSMRSRPSYAHLDLEDVRPAVRRHVRNLIEHFRDGGRPLTSEDEDFFRSMGERRALQGVTIDDLVHVWRVLIDLFRSHVLTDGEGAREPVTLLQFVRTADELDKGLLAMVAGYQRAQSRMARLEHERRGKAVRLLMTPGTDPWDLRRTAEAYGLDTDGLFHAFRARPADERELQRLDRTLTSYGHSADLLYGLVHGDLCGISSQPLMGCADSTIGTAAAVPLPNLPDAFRLATRALTAAVRIGRRGVVRLNDLGLLPTVLSDDDVGMALLERYVLPFQSQGPAGEAVLDTVDALLRNNGKLAPTARELHVHLNTVRYRVARFEEITGGSLRDTERLVEVWWALRRRDLLAK